MASNSELEQADSTATIRLLQGKYGHTKAQHMLWWARRSLAYFGYCKVDIVFTKIIKELAGSGLHGSYSNRRTRRQPQQQ